jgi:hypothetical protein
VLVAGAGAISLPRFLGRAVCVMKIQHRISLQTIFVVFPVGATGDCDLCSCNSSFETNNFGLGTVLLSYLVSELQETPSPGIDLMTFFPAFCPYYVLFLVSMNKHVKFGTG